MKSQVHIRNLWNISSFLNFIISFNDSVLTGSIIQDLTCNDEINMKKGTTGQVRQHWLIVSTNTKIGPPCQN